MMKKYCECEKTDTASINNKLSQYIYEKAHAFYCLQENVFLSYKFRKDSNVYYICTVHVCRTTQS